ncbi:beta-lactamase family protein [Thalassococcus sp. CAU 1522]|uniref:Beta-lactamase family protein n=1 Tax=Thalassococcus arenae TaxID=2851652 RepID=A0ABS6N466_9RHOB|nr:serine hydrolase [Thalassococcus arenae]MBV2358442.1 beta-lactamase family protein [Thalassococcus arenae]
MRRWIATGLKAGLVGAVLLGAAAVWKAEELSRLGAVMTLFDEDRIVANFSNMDMLFETRPIPATREATPFVKGATLTMPADWADFLVRRSVTSALVLRDGAVVHESYHLGTGVDDLRISWSVAKSYLSALFGILLAEGEIDSLDDPVTKYAPDLVGGAYDGATIRNVLQMSSGVEFDEDYLDFWSDINKMGRVLALGTSMDGFAAGLDDRIGPPGERWQYVSIDTHVLSMVLRGATGRSIPELMAEKLFEPLGVARQPYYVTDGYGTAFVLGGLNLTTRDYARMGLMFLQDGALEGRQIVPRDWVRESTQASAPTRRDQTGYGYQWWIPRDATEGEFFARGIYGQYVYVNRPAGVVIALTGADRQFRETGAFDDALEMFRRLTDIAGKEAS